MLALLLVLGCTEDNTDTGDAEPLQGEAAACLAGDFSSVKGLDTTAEDFVVSLAGTVANVREALTFTSDLQCPRQPDWLVELTTAGGATWEVGMGLVSPQGDDDTPFPDLLAGEAVSLVYRHRTRPVVAAGFALTDDEGLVVALDVGRGEPVLEAADHPGLNVADGDVVARIGDDCGTLEYREIWFAGEGSLGVTPYDDDWLEVAGREQHVFAVANFAWPSIACDGQQAERSWALFR